LVKNRHYTNYALRGDPRSIGVIACLRQLVWMFPSDALLSSPRPQYGIPTRSRSLPEAYRWRFGEASFRTFLPVIDQYQTTRSSSLAYKAVEAVFPSGLPDAGTPVEALAQSKGARTSAIQPNAVLELRQRTPS